MLREKREEGKGEARGELTRGWDTEGGGRVLGPRQTSGLSRKRGAPPLGGLLV